MTVSSGFTQGDYINKRKPLTKQIVLLTLTSDFVMGSRFKDVNVAELAWEEIKVANRGTVNQ